MENIFLILIVGILMLLSFYLGSKNNKNNENNVKVVNPIKRYQEYKEEKKQKEEYEKEQEQFKISMENIDKYDGFEFGQKDIPE